LRKDRKTPRRIELSELRRELYRAFGVDLTRVPGINPLTSQVLLTEVGTSHARFPTAAAFCSWLRLCPEGVQGDVAHQKLAARFVRPGTDWRTHYYAEDNTKRPHGKLLIFTPTETFDWPAREHPDFADTRVRTN
jgi:hypothetical protein